MSRNELTVKEMVQLHVDNCTVDAFDRRRIADGSFYAITRASSVTTVDASETNLSHTHRMLPSWRRGVNILHCGCEYFDILHSKANGKRL